MNDSHAQTHLSALLSMSAPIHGEASASASRTVRKADGLRQSPIHNGRHGTMRDAQMVPGPELTSSRKYADVLPDSTGLLVCCPQSYPQKRHSCRSDRVGFKLVLSMFKSCHSRLDRGRSTNVAGKTHQTQPRLRCASTQKYSLKLQNWWTRSGGSRIWKFGT